MGRKGVSGRVKIKTRVQKGMQKTTRVQLHRSAAERAQAEDSYQNQISHKCIACKVVSIVLTLLPTELSLLQREELLADTRMSPEYDASFDLGNPDTSDSNWADNRMDVDGDGFRMLPPREEGLLQSYAGGEAVFLKVWERAKPGQGDSRRRRHHIQKQADSWTRQMPMLVGAYLDTKLHGSITTEDDMPGAYGFLEFGPRTSAYTAESRNTNKTLLRHGYIGGSPDQPTITFALSTFEIYRQIHRLSTTYDAYLEILHGVDNRVQAALNRGEQWKGKNVCPPCFYKLKHEDRLTPTWLSCIDGNNSFKLIDSTFSEVDVFKDEVKNSEKVSMASAAALAAVIDSLASDNTSVLATAPPPCADPPPSPTANHAPPLGTSIFADIIEPNEDVAWLNINELGEDLADELQCCVNTCVECWRNAGPEARKKMFALFVISGIFLSVCHHGHVLVICDMICSRELMKSPLAVVQRLLDVHGEDGAISYDIWCAFVKTLLHSPLKHRVVVFRLSSVVPGFHSHPHN
ncbi:hypothetical protein B0H14DRAFT_3531973 [Mycena olivaceomarginata]|nr:hypothetical protein B0H14DRAFT_3531973 [Mycena olivaceomarginata]